MNSPSSRLFRIGHPLVPDLYLSLQPSTSLTRTPAAHICYRIRPSLFRSSSSTLTHNHSYSFRFRLYPHQTIYRRSILSHVVTLTMKQHSTNDELIFCFCFFHRWQNVQALGFFELQILEIENYRGQLATGECCGGGGGAPSAANRFNAPSLRCAGAPQCNTLFRVCLREYQSRQQQQQPAASSSGSALQASGGARTSGTDDEGTATGSNHQYPSGSSSNLHHCSFGNVTSPVLGGNSFTLGSDAAATDSSSDNGNRGAAGGNLALPFSFSWTVSTSAFTTVVPGFALQNLFSPAPRIRFFVCRCEGARMVRFRMLLVYAGKRVGNCSR